MAKTTVPTHQIQRTLSAHKGARRLWLEGKRLADIGFLAGVRYQRTVTDDGIVLRLSAQGSRKVSRKEGRPVVDTLTRELGDMSRILVTFNPGEVLVAVNPMDLLARNRVRRVNARLARGWKLRLGSLCHGGGVSTDALLRGLGGKASLAFANEYDPSYLGQSLEHGPARTGLVRTFEGDLGDLGTTPEALATVPELDVLEAGLPCVSASRAGKAKKHLAQQEDDEITADLAHAFLNIVAWSKPAVVVLENVPEYATSGTAQMIRRSLKRQGYDLHEIALDGGEWSLEARQRWLLVATSHGLDFDPASLVPTSKPAALGEVLDARVPASSWRSTASLRKKAAKDKALGRGFSRGRKLLTPQATSVPTLRRGYQKGGSCDVRLAHPTRPNVARLFSAAEHARIKGIPPALVAGLSEKKAHEVLGQSVIAPAFVALGDLIRSSARSFQAA